MDICVMTAWWKFRCRELIFLLFFLFINFCFALNWKDTVAKGLIDYFCLFISSGMVSNLSKAAEFGFYSILGSSVIYIRYIVLD